MKKYKLIKMPYEAWERFNKKKTRMEETIKFETKRPNVNIKFTKFMNFISEKPTSYVYPDELVSYFLKRKSKGGFLL